MSTLVLRTEELIDQLGIRQSLTRLTKTAERIRGVIVTSEAADNRDFVQVAGGDVQLTPDNPSDAYRESVLVFVLNGDNTNPPKRLLKRSFQARPLDQLRYRLNCFARVLVITKSLSIRAIRTEPMDPSCF